MPRPKRRRKADEVAAGAERSRKIRVRGVRLALRELHALLKPRPHTRR